MLFILFLYVFLNSFCTKPKHFPPFLLFLLENCFIVNFIYFSCCNISSLKFLILSFSIFLNISNLSLKSSNEI
ncbi:hypothetical protein ECA17_08470 [Campylobacter jejuni]|nr:hypothetical protein [Campylobacter jejuni]EAI1496729.1 hypothetical protein [Campylobacter jejuni]EAI3909437.1 hypothetical protein [Campylobacter jejuni]EAJ3133489.1 hypothetical protein [Campylobacter jejuni]EAJ4028010.1 hypothetical protein [Campylobacter jejuni]